MRTECQIILIHFLLLISHKSPAIAKCCPIPIFPLPVFDRSLITPWLLPNHSPVKSCSTLPSNFWYSWVDGYTERYSSIWTSEDVLSEFFLASESAYFNNPSNVPFTAPVPSSVNEPSKIFLTEDPSGLPCSPNQPNVLPHLQSPEIPPRPHTTSQRKNGPNHHFHLGLISADDPPDPYYGIPPNCFNQVKKLWLWKDTILPIIYFIKYYRGGFGKIWIRKFIYVIFHIFYHSIFACLALILWGDITSHSPLTLSVLISGNVANSLPHFDDPNLKPPDPLVLE